MTAAGNKPNGANARDENIEHAIRLALKHGYVRTPKKKPRHNPGEDDGDDTPGILSRIIRLTPSLLRSPPPKREYMLADSSSGLGVYVRGKVGLLAASGGTGKTWSGMQLAVAKATGATWFGPGGWVPTAAGKVLFLVAEEDEAEVLRMLHFACRAARLNDDQLDLLVRNLDLVPLAGTQVALTNNARGIGLPETDTVLDLRQYLRSEAKRKNPATLVIVDPLSRFAGPDVEKDTTAGTRFMQVLETFAAEDCGRPSVIVACHNRKAGKDDDPTSADTIRGVTAIKDAARWAARLEQQQRKDDSADLLTLRIVKANGIPPQRKPLILCRDSDNEGCLRLATPGEIESNETVAGMVRSAAKDLADYCERVLSVMQPGAEYSRAKIIDACGGRRTTVLAAITNLVEETKQVRSVKRGSREILFLPTAQSVPVVPDLGTGSSESASKVVPASTLSPLSGGDKDGNRRRLGISDPLFPAEKEGSVPAPGTDRDQ